MGKLNRRRAEAGLLALAMAMLAGSVSWATAPDVLGYQGVLLQDDGVVVSDGLWDLRFRLYPQEVGGTQVFEQTLTVEVRNGLYNVILSSQNGYDLLGVVNQHPNLFMEVAVLAVPDPENGGQLTDVTLAPRQQLASVPYALATSGSSSTAFDPATMHALAQKSTATAQNIGGSWQQISLDEADVGSGGAPLEAQVTVPEDGAWHIEIRTQISVAASANEVLDAAVRVTDSSNGSIYWPLGRHWGGSGGGTGQMSLVRSIVPATNGATYTVDLWAVGSARVGGEADSTSLPFAHGRGKSTYLEVVVLPLH